MRTVPAAMLVILVIAVAACGGSDSAQPTLVTSCPNGQRLVLASVSYTNIVLTDTTNGVSTSLPDASRILVAV